MGCVWIRLVASILLVIPLIFLTLTPKILQKSVDSFLKYYFLLCITLAIYIENATFPFMAQYDVRPNYKFVEYLEYPKEVFGMIIADYPIQLAIALLMIALFIYLYLKVINPSFTSVYELSYLKRASLFLPLAIESADKLSPFSRLEHTHFKTSKPKNLVIFLQESLGYQFYEDKQNTPHLNRLSHEGIFFSNLFSNGTRSIRGIAGSIAGNFSIPGKGVVKRNKSQTDYFTISSQLEPLGYTTSFIYGGESRFDNMKGWFMGNGFDKIVDREKFLDPKFVGTWGVCDQEVCISAHDMYKELHAKNQKFASVIFSTTNHSPFDFPDGKITLMERVKKKSVENAIKYADFAIGDFIEKARKEAYYEDTIFVIVADHNVRVFGDDVVPVDMFKIPALILEKDIKPEFYDKLSTQPDVLATVLDLMGLDLTYPIMGHSIYSDKKRELALLQFNDFYALRVKDKVAVIQPKKETMTYMYKEKHLHPIEHDKELEEDALAFILVLNHLYQNKLYR